jgi:two-component system LytT family sensor kinase
MESSTTAATIQALGFATGTALCWLIAALRWKSERSTALSWVWMVGSIWTAGSFARQALVLAGLPLESRAVEIATLLAWSSTCFAPTLVSRIVVREFGPPRSGPILRGASALAAGVLLVLLFAAQFRPGFPMTVESVAVLSAYNLALHVAGWGLIYRAHRRRQWGRLAGRGLFSRLAVVFLSIQLLTILVSIYAPQEMAATRIIGLVSQQMILPGAILTAVFLAKSRYADVVLKRSLYVVFSVVAATLAVWWIPGLPPGLPVLLASLLGAGLLLAAPSLHSVWNRIVDSALLRRPDYRALARAFREESRRTGSSEELFAGAERCIAEALHLTARVLPRSNRGTPEPAGFERIPLKGPGGADHELELTPTTAPGRTLMREEIAFLEAIGTEIARRLEALEFERERRERQLREERLQHSLTEAELKALRAQVDPHFLFNTLNTIAELIATDPRKAETMTERLADFFRYTLVKTDRTLTTLRQEIDFVRQYLEIEQVRFGARLRVELTSDPRATQSMVPALILQPLVENALRHGLAPKPEGGSISVSAACEGEFVRLEVADDGVGMSSGFGRRTGIGLQNVRGRLRTLYGDRAEMKIHSEPPGCGTRVSLLLPKNER